MDEHDTIDTGEVPGQRRPGALSSFSRLFWLATLTGHATAAVAWWWLMPGGFPVISPRFWVNQVLPLVLLGLVLLTRTWLWNRPGLRNPVLWTFPAFWGGFAISVFFAFPIVGPWGSAIALLLCVTMAGALRGQRIILLPAAAAALVVAAALGAAFPWSQRAPAPDTRPLSTTRPAWPDLTCAPSQSAIALGREIRVHPGDATVLLNHGRLTLAVQPVLDFISRSPDRCWTLFASRKDREGPHRRLAHVLKEEHNVHLAYQDDDISTLWIASIDHGVALEAFTHLPRPIWSHLNTFTELTISGHRKLTVSFSPCPDQRIEFRPFSIQGDNPGRAAYLDRDSTFRVVQASRGEKGPFSTLASGILGRDQPLTLQFFDQDKPVFAITFDDFARQAAVQLSPTAGWGLPVNALEFSLDGDSPRSTAGMWISLAATSVGRGWDSVGHAAGTYRNRMRLQLLGTGDAPVAGQ